MGVLDWLLLRSSGPESVVPAIPLPSGGIAPLPAEARDDEEDEGDDAEILSGRPLAVAMPLGDLFCAIEYADAVGGFARRRVTLKTCRVATGGPVLGAICHERRAYRTFRLDRIRCVIDADGEIHAPGVWLQAMAGVRLDGLQAAPGAVEVEQARALRQALGPELAILVTAARSDRQFHIAELDMIEQFAEREVSRLLREGDLQGEFGVGAFDQLRPIIGGMRPGRDTIWTAMRAVSRRRAARRDRLGQALRQVIEADGRVHPAERAMLAEFEAEMARFLRDDSMNPAPGGLSGQVVVFTGTLETLSRREAQTAVRALGGVSTDHLSGKVSLLVVGQNPGQKLILARGLNIPTVDEAGFRRLAGL